MVFSSIPPYLDPSNWQQQQVNHHHHLLLQGGTTNTQTPHLPSPPPQPPAQPHVVGGGGSIRPGSMAERARMANIPVPETALKCPRCDSTNTKFCYFNNYSLSQPRHFCKTCRRYWTRGGALRSVPVGGGCRRNNKRSGKGGGGGGASSSSTTSKSTSTAASNDRQSNSSGFTSRPRGIAQLVDQSIINGLSSPFSVGLSGPTGHNLNLLGLSPQIPSQTFMSPLGQLSDHHYPAGISPPSANLSENIMTLQLGGGDNLLGGSIEPWRLQQPPQFPFLDPMYNFHGGFESPTGFIGSGPSGQIRPRISSAMLAQLAAVKMENNNNNNNEESRFSRQILGINNNEHWNGDNNGGAWSDISASFSSSSTSNTHL